MKYEFKGFKSSVIKMKIYITKSYLYLLTSQA
jgi:hypothetical protein